LQTEEQRRAQAEAEAQRLAQQNQELQQRTQQLEAEQQARAQAEQQAAQQLEAERQARVEAERKATEALTKLDAAAKDLKVREEERGLVLTLSGSVLFASGAVDLLPAARDRLTEVADVLKETKNPLLIEGHTDSQGKDAYNEDLSYRRAERVRDFLAARGVPPERISIRGLGEYRPVANNGTPEGRANNRRVEIIIERDDTAVGGSGEQQGTGGTGTQQPSEEGGGTGTQQQPVQQGGSGTQGTPQPDTGRSGHGGSGDLDPNVEEGVTPPQPGAQPGASDTQPPR
ncbi:OmpA family protein, partial [Pyxidicoccus sp. 3LG]